MLHIVFLMVFRVVESFVRLQNAKQKQWYLINARNADYYQSCNAEVAEVTT